LAESKSVPDGPLPWVIILKDRNIVHCTCFPMGCALNAGTIGKTKTFSGNGNHDAHILIFSDIDNKDGAMVIHILEKCFKAASAATSMRL
jgi:hypothetical protein